MRYVERKLRGEPEIANKTDAINYVNQTNRQMNTYSRSTPNETDTFISNDQWKEIHVRFPQACEPCTRAKSRYKKDYTAVIHKTPGDHTNSLREQMKHLCNNTEEIDDIGNIHCFLCNNTHNVKDGAFIIIILDDSNTEAPLPIGREQLNTHMIIVNIREASIAELAHAWIADFSDLQTNMLVTILGGTTESILQKYKSPEIIATWECFRRDIKNCRSINTIKKGGHNNENQLIIASPMRFPCLWRNLYDVGGRPADFTERQIILKDVVHASNVINIKTRLNLDKIWQDKNIPLTCKPIIHQIDQFPKMSKVGYVNYITEEEKGVWNNGFAECQRAEQRTHDIQGRVDKIKIMDQWFSHTIVQGIMRNDSAQKLAKSYKLSDMALCSKITMEPGRVRYNLEPTMEQYPDACNSRTCTNHFMTRITKEGGANNIEELLSYSRKEHFAKPNTPSGIFQ